jgi:hypothetical protein
MVIAAGLIVLVLLKGPVASRPLSEQSDGEEQRQGLHGEP